MKKSMISVVMISYNHQEFIEASINSVLQQRSDEYDLEILIVDDGSNDDTQKIISKIQSQFPDILFPTFKEHVGITAINKNLNEQTKKAKGDYIAFLAGDDSYINNSLERQLEEFNDKVDLVIGDGINFDISSNEYKNRCQEQEIVEMLIKNNPLGVYEYLISNVPKLFIQGFLIRRCLYEAVGYFDEQLIADDWVLNIKLFKWLSENHREVRYLKYDIFKRNLHGNSTSQNHQDHFLRIYQVIQKYIPKNNKRNILKKVYVKYFVIYTKQRDLVNAFKFFILYIKKDFFMSELIVQIYKRIIKNWKKLL